ncbi:Nucleolar protein 13 [Madurella mycetomatis]|uniref:Nucleolar protein 13 n=1 Tax=Madurella mycetomatis TaxID=100816 RepID=A0A175WAE1_9PEZI|nr:Nucleolar protein 13 [Madurella mycetomatis]
MAAKHPTPTAAEEQQTASSSSKKRKSALTEIQVDLSLPEPPSKKARRALKKGKALPAKPASSDDEGDGKTDGTKSSKKKERSPHGVWIGNLRFSITKAELRKWLVDNSGGSITDDAITRVHMPTTKKPAGAPNKTATENRGFAYVDFASFEANVAAIALSETEMNGRKLLIKDSKSFEGRPKKEEAEVAADAAGGDATTGKNTSESNANKKTPGSTKIFVGNLSFNTTEDDLHAHFEKCGKIRWIKVATFEDSGKCKGYGWVNFEEPEAAQWAVKGFVKMRETVESVEDFMDVDGEQPAPTGEDSTTKDNNNKDAENDNGGDDGEDEDGDDNTNSKKKQQTPKEPPRTRTRKWWVNQLLGRNLKIELAEDDQTRYHKRFGKGAAKQRNHQEQNPKPRSGGGNHDGQDGSTTAKMEKPKKEIHYHNDISVARLTGAAVAHQGKKTTFD